MGTITHKTLVAEQFSDVERYLYNRRGGQRYTVRDVL